MKNRLKKILYILFSLVLVTSLGGCKDKNANNQEQVDIVDTKSLIDNIVKSQETQESKDLAKNEASNKDQNKETKKDQKKEKEDPKKEKTDKEDSSKEEKKAKKPTDKASDKKKNSTKEDIKNVKIKAFGDIMAHMSQINYAQSKGGGEAYDFSDQFLYMKDFISDADIAIGNYETTSNPDLPTAAYPLFNTDASYPKFIKDAGFDIVTTANNHCLDSGEEGIFTTIKAIEDAGLDHVGTQKENDDRIIYKTVNDVKIAFLAYTYGVNGLEGSVVNYDVNKIVNFLDEELIEKDIKVAKNNNADFVVVYPHWGVEYTSYPSYEQIELGRKMIDWGADLVIGNHPHVVQPGEYYKTEDGRRGFIAYALGNFISLQSYETLGDIRTEQSVAYEIDLSKDMKDGYTKIENVKAYPLWVGTTYNEYGGNTQTRLVCDFLEGGKFADQVDENQRERIKQAQDMVSKTVTEDVEYRK